LSLVSCKKDGIQTVENDLPNYGNVDLDNVFSKEDSQLNNYSAIENTLHLYYDKVWEQGDLSGGFLWQKEIKL
jgi:hypothetical protein